MLSRFTIRKSPLNDRLLDIVPLPSSVRLGVYSGEKSGSCKHPFKHGPFRWQDRACLGQEGKTCYLSIIPERQAKIATWVRSAR